MTTALIYTLATVVDVPLLIFAMGKVDRRTMPFWSQILILLVATVAYVLLKLDMRILAIYELPCVSALLTVTLFALFRISATRSASVAVLFCALCCIVVTTCYKLMDYGFGGSVMWAIAVAAAASVVLKASVCVYWRKRMAEFVVEPIGRLQAALLFFLWPTTAAVLAFNRSHEVDPVAQVLATPSALALILCLLSLILIMWVVSISAFQKARLDNLRLQSMVRAQRDLYEREMAGEERMRRVYHDLRHYRTYLEENAGDAAGAQEVLGRVEEAIGPDETQPRTGNAVADVVLGQKGREARAKGVRLVSNMDLSAGGFVEDVDYVCILGNALDNAIDAASHVEDAERRAVLAKAGLVNGHLALVFRNYFSEQPTPTDDGRFYLSTKRDGDEHGQGLPSLRHYAQSYGGNLTYGSKDDVFELCIVLPVPNAR